MEELTDRQLARLAGDVLRRANRLLEDEPLPTRCQGCIDRDCALDALTASRDRWERRWRRARCHDIHEAEDMWGVGWHPAVLLCERCAVNVIEGRG